MPKARFYASTAPEWWPYQLVSLGNRRLPARRYGFYHFLVDNGMFSWWKRGGPLGRPELDKWYAALLRFVYDLERLRKPREIIVVLPDWLYDFPFTYEAANHPMAKRLCRDYTCAVVVHPGIAMGVGDYELYAEKYASIDHVSILAAPLKLPCSRAVNGRRVVKLHCQAAIVGQVCNVAKRYGLKCHGLGVALRPRHVKRLVGLGLDSFDSSSWTRPVNKPKAATAGWSAKNKQEREQYFKLALQRLAEAGVELEWLEEIKAAVGVAGRG